MRPVIYTPNAEKYFKKLKDSVLLRAYRDAISRIRENPDIGEMKSGDLSGIYDRKHVKTLRNREGTYVCI